MTLDEYKEMHREESSICDCGKQIGDSDYLCPECKLEAEDKFKEFIKTLSDNERGYLELEE